MENRVTIYRRDDGLYFKRTYIAPEVLDKIEKIILSSNEPKRNYDIDNFNWENEILNG